MAGAACLSLVGAARGIDREEMYRTFNMGVGMAVILGEDEADKAREVLAQHGWESWPIGHVVKGKRECGGRERGPRAFLWAVPQVLRIR